MGDMADWVNENGEIALLTGEDDDDGGEAMGERIEFYGGWLSNFSEHTIEVDGKSWPTVEHYFQAMKFEGTDLEEKVREAPGPWDAKRIGRSGPLREDWEAVKEMFMYNGLLAKFTQHPILAMRLVATGGAEIVEHTETDSYWGDGGDGSGKNRLGQLLMRLRDELRMLARRAEYDVPEQG